MKMTDDLAPARGFMNGVLISIVIWAIIIGLTILMCSCKKIEYDNTTISSLANSTCREVLIAQEKCGCIIFSRIQDNKI